MLIVGRGPTLDKLGDRLGQPVVQVENLMEAIGELTTLQPQGPFRSVIISAEVAKRATGRAIDALKLVDPSVEVLLHVAPPDDSIAASVIGRFDGHFLEPDQDESTPEPPEDRAVDSPEGEPEAVTPPQETAPAPTARPEPEEESASLADRASPEDELGDIDLIAATCADGEDVEAVALRLIRQQTGWSDVALLDDPAQAEAGASWAAVTEDEQCFGYLAATRAGQAEIEPWASWLACWLTFAQAWENHKKWAYTDDLTSVGNRRFFNKFLREAIAQARVQRRVVTVMVFDIDDFKLYNDRFGHEAGDEILRETVALLASVIRRGDRVCRIGGDEFAVVFADPEDPREPGSSHPDEIEQITRRFREQIASMRFPKLGIEARGSLTISGGLATYPWDGLTPDELLRLADQRAMQSKRKGKNVITFGPDAAEDSPDHG
ncbi:MAG: diguanylate cyclase [Phycisphaerales bacterium]|nr:MAG: diguanylate cyclase [Phycisphaerales bacterium]